MNKYEKLGVIGEGTFGEVYKARHKETDEVVAIKRFKEQSEEDDVSKKITLREVKLLKALKHENIVELKEAFRRKGVLFLVFEFVEKSVMDLLEAKPKGVGSETVHTLTYQLLRALEHCHRHNVIHRDIKPENLLVNTVDNSLRLCDFGCARQIKANVPLTDYVATRWYRPPELLLSTTDYGKGVDMWGLGCIMGELTDGQPLFAGKSDIDQLCVIQKILGPMTSDQMARCLELSDFQGVQFPDVNQPVTLEQRYAKQMPEHHLNLLKSVLVMDAAQRLSAKAAIRLACFKDFRTKDSEKPPMQPKQLASGGTAHQNSQNANPVTSGTTDHGLPPKVPKPRSDDADVPPWMRDADTPPNEQVPSRNQKPQKSQVAPPEIGGLPSIGASTPAGVPMDVAAAQAKPQKLLPDSLSAIKKDFRTSHEAFDTKRETGNKNKKDFRASQENFGAKREIGAKKELRSTQENFGAKAKKDFRTSQENFGARAKKDLRVSQENFGAKRKEFRTTQEGFGAKKGSLRTALEEEPMVCEETLEDFLAAPLDAAVPSCPLPRKSTPQAADYCLPWDDEPASEDQGMGDCDNDASTPIFGSGSQKGFLVDPRGGAAAGAPAKNTKAPQALLSTATRWQMHGVRESRWSGA